MSINNLSRRQFLQSAFYSSLLYSAGAIPNIASNANAAPAALTDRTLVDLFLDGGPDFRHLIVPAYSAVSGSFGQKYWQNRERSHNLSGFSQTAQQRWNNDYYHITVGDNSNNWNGSLVDVGNLNSGVEFGIWKEAGWLIDMFRAGDAALIFNAVGGTNRAHDLSKLMLKQGNVLSTLNEQNRSGWGGRLARSAGANAISLTSTPSPFTFGPLGNATNYNPNVIDNSDLIAVENSREMGLYEFDISENQHRRWKDKMARTAESYYAALRKENLPSVYNKALQHEENLRKFGRLLKDRLDSVPLPAEIEALYSSSDLYSTGVANLNPEPGTNDGRPVLNDNYHFAPQIRNLYDILAVSDLEDVVNNLPDPSLYPNFMFKPQVLSMIYGGWDTHSQQRPTDNGNVLVTDPNNPNLNRGIENGFRDIFGGQFGISPSNSSSLHGAFSALWKNLPSSDRQNLVITVAGEFGRQIRDNGDRGTDHGKGNLMLVIGEGVSGGVYGELFPQSEIIKYDEDLNRTPDIDPRSEIDHIFSKVCDWVAPGSSTKVFPRTASGYSGEIPIIEVPGMFDNLFS